nr:hypothetical protein RTCK_02225 [Rhizobium sp. TCK]
MLIIGVQAAQELTSVERAFRRMPLHPCDEQFAMEEIQRSQP